MILFNSDCQTALRALKDNTVDAMVTDPPAGISFMGAAWDSDKGGRATWTRWLTSVFSDALRVLKPGAHCFVWALPRTAHWTMSAVEDAGLEVRDVVTHLFGSGFPKSHDLGDGRGTALKPAAEFWILCRKPLSERTTKANVERWGTGGINIDACRIGTERRFSTPATPSRGTFNASPGSGTEYKGREVVGRWPANLTLDETVAPWVDQQSGRTKSRRAIFAPQAPNHIYGQITRDPYISGFDDEGGASRFFYCAKASVAEKQQGLEDLPDRDSADISGGGGSAHPKADAYQARKSNRKNHHPTVKPVSLMRWLCRLVCPPGGLVIDPFLGSGTTGVAAALEDLEFIGVEQNPDYFNIAMKRIQHFYERAS